MTKGERDEQSDFLLLFFFYDNELEPTKDNIKHVVSLIYTILLITLVITYLFKKLICSTKEGVVNAKPYGEAQIRCSFVILNKGGDIIMHENENKILEELLVVPLCIVQDRYGGCYSGAEYLAFNMLPFFVGQLAIDAGDMSCQEFWEHEAEDYIIGKGNTPLEALCDLQIKLTSKK